MNTNWNDRRHCAGFTLVEVLITLVILAILAAIAVPAVVTLRQKLKQTELDAYAREIFIAAQNNLAGMHSAGTLSALSEAGMKDATDAPDPALKYLSTSEGTISVLLPPGAVDATVAAGGYVIVFNPTTGAARQVYYKEKSPDFSYRDVVGLHDSDACKEAGVGYYGGDDIQVDPAKDLAIPQITIENGDALVVRVSSSLLGEQIGKVNLTITASSQDGTRAAEMTTLLTASGETSWILDQLGGTPFQVVTTAAVSPGKTPLIPGEQLVITARLSCHDNAGLSYRPASATAGVNSLFASRRADQVDLTCARHLQNLNRNYSGVQDTVRRAILRQPVRWNPLLEFIPIENPALSSFDGGSLPIAELRTKPTQHAGLFGVLFGSAGSPVTLENIRLVNPKIATNVSTGSTAGALAGTLEQVEVSNCLVYATDEATKGDFSTAWVKNNSTASTGATGGLVGHAIQSTFTNCALGLPSVNAGNGYLGGLLGLAEGCTISHSYAAVDQLSGSFFQAAMFLGQGQATTVTDCYAVGNLSANRQANNPTQYLVSGFMNGTGTVTNAYCATTYFNEKGGTRDFTINFAFRKGSISPNCWYLALTPGITNQNDEESGGNARSYEALQKLVPGTEWVTLEKPSDSHPYEKALQGLSYPFSALKIGAAPLPHYGSWPLGEAVATMDGGFAYYELYQEGSYGFYTLEKDGTPRDTLDHNNQKDIIGAGYGVLLTEKATDVNAALPVFLRYNSEPTACPMPFQKTPTVVTSNRITTYLYPFTTTANKEMEDRARSVTPKESIITVGGREYYFVPQYAAGLSAYTGTHSGPQGSEDTPFQIRTQRQLTNMGANQYSSPLFFHQTHNITMSTRWAPIPVLDHQQIFDGQGNVIFKLNAPLFSTLKNGTVRNVNLENAKIENALGTGILAQAVENSSLVENCTVSNASLSGDGPVAGFIGEVQAGATVRQSAVFRTTISSNTEAANGFVNTTSGTIQDCMVVGGSITASGSGASAAGFAGKVSSGTIQTSYVNSNIIGSSASGFVTKAEGGTVRNCYTLLRVTATSDLGQAAGFTTHAGGTISRCYSAATVLATDPANVFGFSPVGSRTSCFYLTQHGLTTEAQGGTSQSYADLSNNKLETFSGWRTPTQDASHPFDSGLTVYPFPMLASLDHYGDWPAIQPMDMVPNNTLGMFQYTQLGDGRIQITALPLSIQLAPDDNKSFLTIPDPSVWSGTLFTGASFPSGTPTSGFGVFWQTDLALPDSFALDQIHLMEENGTSLGTSFLREQNDLKLSDHFIFVPLAKTLPSDSLDPYSLFFQSDNEALPWNQSATFYFTEQGTGAVNIQQTDKTP